MFHVLAFHDPLFIIVTAERILIRVLGRVDEYVNVQRVVVEAGMGVELIAHVGNTAEPGKLSDG